MACHSSVLEWQTIIEKLLITMETGSPSLLSSPWRTLPHLTLTTSHSPTQLGYFYAKVNTGRSWCNFLCSYEHIPITVNSINTNLSKKIYLSSAVHTVHAKAEATQFATLMVKDLIVVQYTYMYHWSYFSYLSALHSWTTSSPIKGSVSNWEMQDS